MQDVKDGPPGRGPLHLLLPVWLWLLSSIGGGWVAVDTPKMAWLRRVEGVVLDVHRERLR